ncbi:MAG: hypothetical protein WC565_05215 [Parcubacteria group bacterium]|jgi:hypothetical protein
MARFCCECCGGDAFYLEGKPSRERKPVVVHKMTCAKCGCVAAQVQTKEEIHERAVSREREVVRLKAQGLSFRLVGEMLGIRTENARQLAEKFQRRAIRLGRVTWPYIHQRTCTCPVCCKGVLAVEEANEGTREAFEARHPEIAEARALLVPDPGHGEGGGEPWGPENLGVGVSLSGGSSPV